MNAVPEQPMASLELQVAGEQITLLAGRGLWWPREHTLFIADPHFGKAATFRSSGIPVPEATHEVDLARLSHLLHGTGAARLVILGDFFHARQGCNETTLTALHQWRQQWPELEILLVLGNHDRAAGPPPAELRITTVNGPYRLPPFAACHEPQKVPDAFALAGHLHPACRVASHTVPCFHATPVCLVFPAFGTFTGSSRVKPTIGDQVYLVSSHEIVMLPSALVARR